MPGSWQGASPDDTGAGSSLWGRDGLRRYDTLSGQRAPCHLSDTILSRTALPHPCASEHLARGDSLSVRRTGYALGESATVPGVHTRCSTSRPQAPFRVWHGCCSLRRKQAATARLESASQQLRCWRRGDDVWQKQLVFPWRNSGSAPTYSN